MAFEISQRFTLRAPATAVWEFLIDPHRVAASLPGAAITGQEDDETELREKQARSSRQASRD